MIMIKTFKSHEISKQFVEKFRLGEKEHEFFSFLAHNKMCWRYVVSEYDRYGRLLSDEPVVLLCVEVAFSTTFLDLEIFKKNKPIDLFLRNGEIIIEIDKILETLEIKEIDEIFEKLEK